MYNFSPNIITERIWQHSTFKVHTCCHTYDE